MISLLVSLSKLKRSASESEGEHLFFGNALGKIAFDDGRNM